MHEIKTTQGASKAERYRELLPQLAGVLAGERDGLANCANTAALIYQHIPRLNWAGFYFRREGELVLGPFQGKVACIRIKLGRGVCGTAAVQRETIIVPDVEQFPGHIACDSASRSEIVVPLLQSGRLVGVLDLDSPELATFDRDDAEGLAQLVAVLVKGSDFSRLAD